MRGRKREYQKTYSLYHVEIYPREGTETLCEIAKGYHLVVEIYPREGTETSFFRKILHKTMVEIYPREGTETSFARLSSAANGKLKFIPVRGRKL